VNRTMAALFALAAVVAWFLWPQNATPDQASAGRTGNVVKVADTGRR